MLEGELAEVGVIEELDAVAPVLHHGLFPPLRELCALPPQLGDEILEPRIANVVRIVGSKVVDQPHGMRFPVGDHGAQRTQQGHAQAVTLGGLQGGEIPEHRAGRAVPGEQVPALAVDVGRAGIELVEQALQVLVDAVGFDALIRRSGHGVAGQKEQMAGFGRLQPEDGGDTLERLRGGAHVPRLLQPLVPLRADAGEEGHLFPPQPRRAPPPAGGQPDVLRPNPFTARFQKAGDFLSLFRAGHRGSGNNLYQDKRFLIPLVGPF